MVAVIRMIDSRHIRNANRCKRDISLYW